MGAEAVSASFSASAARPASLRTGCPPSQDARRLPFGVTGRSGYAPRVDGQGASPPRRPRVPQGRVGVLHVPASRSHRMPCQPSLSGSGNPTPAAPVRRAVSSRRYPGLASGRRAVPVPPSVHGPALTSNEFQKNSGQKEPAAHEFRTQRKLYLRVALRLIQVRAAQTCTNPLASRFRGILWPNVKFSRSRLNLCLPSARSIFYCMAQWYRKRTLI